MDVIKNFSLESVPQHKILLVVTSPDDYSMSHMIVAEDYPDVGDMTVIEGYHCSCYGFDDTTWEAMTYTEKELKAVLLNWLSSGMDTEKLLAQAWLLTGRTF